QYNFLIYHSSSNTVTGFWAKIMNAMFGFSSLVFMLFWQKNQKTYLALACPGYVVINLRLWVLC
ncbi:MAG: hypothetical protein QM498_05880, partial [Desulfobacterium sp.]